MPIYSSTAVADLRTLNAVLYRLNSVKARKIVVHNAGVFGLEKS